MSDVVVYGTPDGIAVAYPGTNVPVADVIARDVPPGAPHKVVDVSALPIEEAYRDAWTADFSSEDFAITLDPAKKAAIDKQIALADVEEWFESAIEEGFLSDSGIRLGITTADVTLLTGNYVLAKEASALGMALPPVVDRHGVPHVIETIEDMSALMLAYGQYRAGLSAEYVQKKAEIESGNGE